MGWEADSQTPDVSAAVCLLPGKPPCQYLNLLVRNMCCLGIFPTCIPMPALYLQEGIGKYAYHKMPCSGTGDFGTGPGTCSGRTDLVPGSLGALFAFPTYIHGWNLPAQTQFPEPPPPCLTCPDLACYYNIHETIGGWWWLPSPPCQLAQPHAQENPQPGSPDSSPTPGECGLNFCFHYLSFCTIAFYLLLP